MMDGRYYARIFAALILGTFIIYSSLGAAETRAHWRFEQTQALDGSLTPAVAGESLTVNLEEPIAPRPFTPDDSGNGNHLQVWEPADRSSPSPTKFSDETPVSTIDGAPNRVSLAIRGRDYFVRQDRPLASADLSKSWKIEAMVMTRRLDQPQGFVCKDRTTGIAPRA